MNESSSKSGIIVSGALHAALLAAILIGFSAAPKFDDSAVSIPMETITQSEFNQIMKGERDGKLAKTPIEKPAPKPIEATAPTPPAEPAKVEPPAKELSAEPTDVAVQAPVGRTAGAEKARRAPPDRRAVLLV